MGNQGAIYKSQTYKEKLFQLYDEKIKSLELDVSDIFVETSFGKTHVAAVGDESLPPLVVLHGINAGAGLAIEPIKGLAKKHRIYGVDTIGQAGKSDETRLSPKGEDYGVWLSEVLDKLELESAPVVGVSYGSVILSKLIAVASERIEKAIFVVPIIFANGRFFESVFKLLLPMRKFIKTESEENLRKFIGAFWDEPDDFALRLQRNILLGVKMDTRRPPLIRAKDANGLEAPVYILAADDDIFSPVEKVKKYAPKVIKNLAEIRVLENSKHVPARKRYQEIEETIGRWLERRYQD